MRTRTIIACLTLLCGTVRAEERTAIFVPVPKEPSWQEFAYLAAVPAAQKLQPGRPAVVALDEHATVTPEAQDWLARYKPTAIHQFPSHADAQSRPRTDTESGLVKRWLPRGESKRRSQAAPQQAKGESTNGAALPSGPFTVGAWVRMPSRGAGAEKLISCGEDGKSGWSLGLTSKGNAKFEVVRADDGIVETCTGIQTELEPERWHHIAGVMEADGTLRLYNNGRLIYFLPLGTAAKPGDDTLKLATNRCEVDEVQLFSRALTSREVAVLAENPLPPVTYGVANARPLPADGAASAAVSCSLLAWRESQRVVLADDARYGDALLAASLAARLGCPLLFTGQGDTLPPATAEEMKRLKTDDVICIGAAASGQPFKKVTRLADAVEVAAWLRAQGIPCDYLAVANAHDRKSGLVRKSSLAAALLAATRSGIVVPLDFDTQWRAQLWNDRLVNEPPPGAASRTRIWGQGESWEHDAKPPRLTPAFQSPIHPVRGIYEKRAWGPYSPKMALVSTTPDSTEPDRVLVDVNGDNAYGPEEMLAVGDRFTMPPRAVTFNSIWPVTLRVVSLHHGQKVELAWDTWLTGRTRIGDKDRSFIISSLSGFGFDSLQVDLDGDNRFDGKGAGPFQTTDAMQIDGREWAVTVNHHYTISVPGHAALTYPSPAAVKTEIEQVHQALGRHAKYLCIVGLYDAIPFSAVNEPITRCFETTSDFYYANTDADPFQDIATGRVVGESTLDVTLLATRTATYEQLWDPSWGRRVLATGDWVDSSREHTLRLENAGFLPADERIQQFKNHNLTNRAVLVHADHACHWGWGWGPTMALDDLLAPTFADGCIGCVTVGLDQIRPNKSPRSPHPPLGQWVSTLMLHKGAVAVLGNTRPASGFNNTAHAVFWDSMLEGKTVGESMRDGLNAAIYTAQHGGHPYLQAVYQTELLGDPAWKLRVPSALKIRPASVEASGSKLVVKGPQEWWPVTEHGGRLRQFAPGSHPEYNILGHVLARWTTPEQVTSLKQITETAKPLGWTGKWMVDEHEDGTRTLYWRVKMIDQDARTGAITKKFDSVEFHVQTAATTSLR